MQRTEPPAQAWLRSLVALSVAVALLVCVSSATAAGSIAFIRQGNVWIANPDGTGAKQLTTDGAGASVYTSVSAAKSSPLLAYLHAAAPGTIAADGTGNHQLAYPNRPPRNSSSIHLDSAGQRLTWVTNESASTYGVGLNIDGSSPVIFGTGRVFNTTWDDNQGTGLYSSYDYECPNGILHNHLTIETPKPDNGTNAPNPGTYICSSGLSYYYPDVSTSGQQIALTADTDAANIGDPTNRIMVLANAPATSAGTFVTPSGLGAVKPNWSPDGTTIAFGGTGSTIWTVAAAGGTPVKILDDATSPAWTPYSASAGGGNTGGNAGGGTGGNNHGGGGTKQVCPASTLAHANCVAAQNYAKALARCAGGYGKTAKACRKKAKLAYTRALALAHCQTLKNAQQRTRCIHQATKGNK